MALEFDSTNRRPGYRLHRLELYNWGTFDSTGGQVYRFEPCGRTALMVGHNGSGKSTLVDALLTLLVASGKRSYNFAAGAKPSERNEESYIRGAVGRTSDDSQFTVVKYLRDRGSSYSALSAVFRDESLDRAFTLCVILHLTANGRDKVFALADEVRELRDDLQGLRSSDAIRSHFDALGYRTTKTFSEYHGWVTRRTGMRPKAMDLFSQTVSVKDIQSLNDFIRKRMLEAHDWREKVDRLLTHFNDLSIAHQELVRARRSQQLLIPVALLHRFNYRCCNTVEEFDECEMAITVNRHIKRGRDHHIKDDRRKAVDPLSFILGWDNHDKKRRLADRIQELQGEERRFDATIKGHSEAVTQLRRRLEAVEEALALHDFDAIDVQRHQREISALEQEKAQLESDNEAVQALKKRLAETEEFLKELKVDRDDFVREEDRLSKFIDQGKLALANADRDVDAARSNGDLERHEPFFDAIREALSKPPLSCDNLQNRRPEWLSRINADVLRLTKALEGPKDKLVAAMNRYLNEMREEQADLTASVDCLGSFLDRLQQIRDEDLPRFADKFKQGLNDKVSQEIGTFHSGLRRECQELVNRIEQLNEALSQLDFNTGTFIRLEPRQASDRAIDEFKNALRECLAESFENTDDANEARFVRIQSLVERMANKEEAKWRDHVIDVRNWYCFVAHEIDKETNEVRDEFDGSSGRSGGEKAKLAFTILVAAIAYQNDIDPDEMAPGRFHFVVVDEMFSKIDDENAKRALRLFERFGLQLLIVAPLDAKARVTEPFVDSYLHVVKDESSNRSQLFSMTAREYDEVVRAFEGDSITTDDIRRVPK